MTAYYRSIESNLNLTHAVLLNVVRGVSASNTLNLTSLALTQYKTEIVTSTIYLTDELSIPNWFFAEASHSLNLTQSAVKSGTSHVESQSELNLTHTARSSLRAEGAEHTLDLQHSVIVKQPKSVSATSNLLGSWEDVDPAILAAIDPYDTEAVAALFETIGLRQEVSLRRSVYNISVTSYLSLSHQANRTQIGVASNHIHLSHQVKLVEYEIVESRLYLQHEAICHKVQSATSVLELEHNVIITGDFPRTASSQLNLRSVVSPIIINFCDYTPGVGEGNFDYIPPPVTPPTLIRRATTVLTWPYNTPTLTLELRNPNFDNVEQFESRRVNRRTRGGTLDLYRDESWPKVQRLIMSFSWLCEDILGTRTKLFEFLQRSIGQEIGLLDFESRQWKGILLTPSNAVSEPKRNGHSFTLEFEGDLV